MADLAKLADDLSSLTVLEAAELTKMLEEKWGVSAAAPVAVAAAVGGGAAPAAAAEQTEFTIILAAAGDKKINVIKEVRAITGSASRRPRTWLKARRSRSRKAFPRTTRPSSRSSSKKLARPFRSSNRVFARPVAGREAAPRVRPAASGGRLSSKAALATGCREASALSVTLRCVRK